MCSVMKSPSEMDKVLDILKGTHLSTWTLNFTSICSECSVKELLLLLVDII